MKPTSFILNLRRKVPLDVQTVKRLRVKLLCGCEEEDPEGFKKRLVQERDALGCLPRPIVVADADLVQHYLEEMCKRSDVFDRVCMTAFYALDATAQQDLEAVTEYFERVWDEAELYIANGGKPNKFADAGAVEDLQTRHDH